MIDLRNLKQHYFTWPIFEFEEINCPIDRYKVTCIDSNDDEYTVDFTSNVLASTSQMCAGFTFDNEKRIIMAPYVTTPTSEYEGSYTFLIFGANHENVSFFSEVLKVSVRMFYDTDNTAPYLSSGPGEFRVGLGYTVTKYIGSIIDDQGDDYYLEQYTLSTEDEIPWIILRNQTD